MCPMHGQPWIARGDRHRRPSWHKVLFSVGADSSRIGPWKRNWWSKEGPRGSSEGHQTDFRSAPCGGGRGGSCVPVCMSEAALRVGSRKTLLVTERSLLASAVSVLCGHRALFVLRSMTGRCSASSGGLLRIHHLPAIPRFDGTLLDTSAIFWTRLCDQHNSAGGERFVCVPSHRILPHAHF